MKDFGALPEGSPAAPLAAALARLGELLADVEHQAMLPPDMGEAFFDATVSALGLLHQREAASRGRAGDAVDDARWRHLR